MNKKNDEYKAVERALKRNGIKMLLYLRYNNQENFFQK